MSDLIPRRAIAASRSLPSSQKIGEAAWLRRFLKAQGWHREECHPDNVPGSPVCFPSTGRARCGLELSDFSPSLAPVW